MPTDPNKARYYRKQVPLFRLVEKVKLWPSRRGILHGIKQFDDRGAYAVVVTHCDKHMVVHDSKTSRAARWLRNKWYAEACPKCRIPDWKLQKYASTQFKRGLRVASQGSLSRAGATALAVAGPAPLRAAASSPAAAASRPARRAPLSSCARMAALSPGRRPPIGR